MTLYQVAVALLLAIPAVYLYRRISGPAVPAQTTEGASDTSEKPQEEPKSIMQPVNTELDPPKDDPFTLEQLKAFDGSDASKPLYVSIKGTVFDVSRKRDTYGPGGSYNVFAGKDASKGLGMSSLKTEDAIPDFSTLPEAEMKVLNDWHSFFLKRYNVVGRVTDMPETVANL